MDKLTERIKGCLPTRRRLIQLYAALLYNAHLKGFISGDIYTGGAKVLCVPGLNCYSCPGAVGACPLGALQNALASSGNRAPTYILGILLLYGLILGRTVCGWLCPAGLLQELLHKLPTPKLKKGRVTRALSYLKYVLLAIFVVVVPLYYGMRNFPLPAFCKYICPAGTLEGAVGLLANGANRALFTMLGGLFTWKFILLLAIIGICIFAHRAFCRFLCPLGAIYGLFARVNIIGVKVQREKCIDCARCVGCCPMDIRRVGDHECIHCGKCIEECPTAAISMKAGKAVLIEKNTLREKGSNRRRTIAAWLLALAVLAAALCYFSRPEERIQEPALPEESFREVGSDVGMEAPDFTAPLYGGGSFTLSEHRGKTVVLNFWATWCSPCVAELPHFDTLYEKYGEEIVVIALHSSLVTDDVEEYLSRFDYSMPFGLDESGGVIAAYGGSTLLPHTVVIDPDGIISYNAAGSVDYEKLETLIGK